MFALAEWTQANAQATPGRTAVIVDGQRLTWSEIARARLEKSKFPHVLAADNATLALGLFEAALAGRTFMPLNPALPRHMQDRLHKLVGPGGAAELVVGTSGSASTDPKAVMLSGDNIRAHVRASRRRLGLSAEDVWLACMPMYHIGALSIPLRCAEVGATTVVHRRFDPALVLSDLEARRVSHLSLVPAMLARLLDASTDPPPPSLRICLVGGAALPPSIAARAVRAGWPVCTTYGMSEACSQVATMVGIGVDWPGKMVGRPLDGFEVAISPEDGRIRVRGPAVMLGYANPEMRPGLGLDEHGWFTSGDIGRFDGSGRLHILGRADDVIVTGGENVHPLSVESVALECKGVEQVGVVGRPDAVWGEVVVVAFSGSARPEDVLEWCRLRLPSEMRPREAVKLPTLPLGPTGKVDRRALRRLVLSGI